MQVRVHFKLILCFVSFVFWWTKWKSNRLKPLPFYICLAYPYISYGFVALKLSNLESDPRIYCLQGLFGRLDNLDHSPIGFVVRTVRHNGRSGPPALEESWWSNFGGGSWSNHLEDRVLEQLSRRKVLERNLWGGAWSNQLEGGSWSSRLYWKLLLFVFCNIDFKQKNKKILENPAAMCILFKFSHLSNKQFVWVELAFLRPIYFF